MTTQETNPSNPAVPVQPGAVSPGAPGQQLTLDQVMQLASKHQQAGELPQAETLLRQILKVQPKHPYALQLLGVIAHQVGQVDAAIKHLSEAISIMPNVAQFHSNCAEMCRQVGRLDDAVQYGENAVKLDANSAQAHSNLGIAYYDRGELEKAEVCQQRALKINPTMPQALNNLGSIQRDRKHYPAAIEWYKKAIAHNPTYLESANNLGAVLTESERPEEAVPVLLQVIKARPGYAEAHCNIACAFLAMEDFKRAAVGFKKAIELKPDYPQALEGLAKLHQEQNELPEALSLAQRALALTPQRAEVHSLLGGIYTEQGFPDKAAQAYAQALDINPALLSAHLGKGHLLMEKGDMAGAEASFNHALSLDPDGLAARLSLSQVRKTKPGDDNLQALEKKAQDLANMSETKALSLYFGLGKSYDDIKDYQRAFPHFLEGCRLKRKRIQYNADDNTKACENIKEFFTPETIDNLRGAGESSDVPIFVLGMPRSGTTLTEQILASHPDVYGAGELHDLLHLAGHPKGEPTGGFPLSMRGLTPDDLASMGAKYIAGLRERAPDAHRITDKMPANFFCVGLMHLMLPNARIVHVNRNPVDTCLSGFTRLFNKSQYHSYDLAEIGRYYRNYAQLMDHWRTVLPQGAFLDVRYEDLVADNEGQARRLLEYCNLDWHAACLDFHKTERTVRTASVTQVRQPIYSSSVERWRKYEQFLGPLLKELGDLVPESA
ncbi:MAG: tetratricopeptide repeat protein [Gammaproteobacteria bacterium]|nr:tetratricopeptide repeat protein [Gammaproteobacteria bacterium]